MTDYETPSGQQATSRRSLPNARNIRIGITEQLSAPGLAVQGPATSNLAMQLNRAVGGIAGLVGDLGQQAAQQRVLELRSVQEAEREYAAQQRELHRDAREQANVDRLIAIEDRRGGSEVAQIYALEFENELKAGKVQFGDDPTPLIRDRIAQATQGQSPEYAEAFAGVFYKSALRGINSQREEIRTKAYNEAITRAPSTALTLGDANAVAALVDDLHALDTTVPITAVAAKVIVPAATRAAESGDAERTKMLTGLLKDETFAIDKEIIENKLASAQTAIKSRNESQVVNSISRKLSDPETSIETVRRELQLNSGRVDGKTLLQLTNTINEEERKRLTNSREQVTQANVDAFKTKSNDDAVAAFRAGAAYSIESVGGEDGLPQLSASERKAQAAQTLRRSYAEQYPQDPQTASTLYVRDIAQNGYADPLIQGFLSGGYGFLSQAMTADETGDAIKQIQERHAQYRFVKTINPTYAKSIAGASADLYEAIDAIDATFPASNIPVAIDHIARSRKENVSVSFSTTEMNELQTAAQSVSAPWFTSNAQNVGDISSKMEQLTRAYVLMGNDFQSAKGLAQKRIADSHSIINNWMIETQDTRFTPTVKQNLTNLMFERFNAYKAKHGKALQSLGLDDPDLWTMDYNPETGYFSIVGKNPGDILPIIDPALTVIDIDSAVRETARIDKQKIINEQQERARLRANPNEPNKLMFPKF